MNIERTEPSADERRFARQMRGIFMALMLQGFTEQQALNIIGVMLAATIQDKKG